MFNNVNVVTIFKGSWVGKVYDEHVDYNCNGAINSEKLRGRALVSLQVSSNWSNSSAHVLAK